ncbi:MAG: SapC family protein [Gammaproteobacteria bacterium]|nr:SapC family protein [Gammaproteobacteria bacterium]
MANFQPLHKNTHANTKLKQASNVEDLRNQHALGVVVQEFAVAGANYPIAFVKEEGKESYFPVAILGLEQNKNLFVSEEGKWQGMYMPARYTHKPLSVIPNKDDPNLFGIAINMDSEVVSEEEGEALFTEAGEETEYLEKRKQSLMTYVENEQITKAFLEAVAEMGLLHQQNISVKVREKEYNLNGLYLVDEKKLNELSDEDFLKLRSRGFLGPIFAHLSSMHQVTALIQKQAQVSE